MTADPVAAGDLTAARQESNCHSPSSEDSSPGSAGSNKAVEKQASQVKKRVSLED